MRTRIIVFFLTVTQCFLVGCNLRNPSQRRPPQDPFSTQEPFPGPTGRDTERNRDGTNTERGTGDTERNREGNTERDRNGNTERDRDGNTERDRNGTESDREDNNRERNRGGERTRRKRIHCAGFTNQLGECQADEINLQAPQPQVEKQ